MARVAVAGMPGSDADTAEGQNRGVRSAIRRLFLVSGVSAALLGGGLLLLQRWVSSDDFRLRVEAQAGQALARPVHIGRLSVDLWPTPGVALEQVRIETRPAMEVGRIEVRPAMAALLAGHLELASLLVRQTTVSQAAVDDLVQAMADPPSAARPQPPRPQGEPGLAIESWVPRRVVLEALTWIGKDAAATTVDANARLDRSGLPDTLEATVSAGRLEGARVRVTRSQPQLWQIAAELGGGTIQGELQQGAGSGQGAIAIHGVLQTRQVELGVLLRRMDAPARAARGAAASPMRGKLDGQTSFSASAARPGALADALQTRSQFVVRNAVVEGVDLVRAVRTVGMSKGGSTALDTLRGEVITQGRAVQLRNLVAASGQLSLSGDVSMSPQQRLQGRVEVHLGEKMVGKAVGVPLVVGGTLSAPEVTLTRAALAGAAIGSVLMPGVGTGAGAALGDTIGTKLRGLFGK